MIILDTSVWIEHLRNNPQFFPKVGKLLETGEALAGVGANWNVARKKSTSRFFYVNRG